MIDKAEKTMKSSASPIKNRTLFTGDNLEVMRAMNSESVHLIYLDPPFNKKYVFPIGKGEIAEFGFKDVWGWDSAPDETNPYLPYAELYAYNELVEAADNGNPLIDSQTAQKIISLLETMGKIVGHAEMAYLSFMAARLVEMRRILKESGSIYLHCDPTMAHSLKLLLDCVFGENNFRNEIIWCYKSGGASKTAFAKKHDNIYFYTKADEWLFNYEKEKSYGQAGGAHGGMVKYYKDSHGTYSWSGTKDWWQLSILAPTSSERTGYPTQKPIALMEKIIKASSNEGDIVLDPFCGCATTCVAAERLGRQWLGIDVASKAASLVRKRLLDETKQGKLGEKVPKVTHARFDEGECPIMRTDLGEIRSKNIRQILYGRQEGRCNLCKHHFELRHFHTDHIIARSKGGPDVDANLQLLCASCNTIKSARSMENARKRLKELGYV